MESQHPLIQKIPLQKFRVVGFYKGDRPEDDLLYFVSDLDTPEDALERAAQESEKSPSDLFFVYSHMGTRIMN